MTLFPSKLAGIKAPFSERAKEFVKQCLSKGKHPVIEAMRVWRENKMKETE